MALMCTDAWVMAPAALTFLSLCQIHSDTDPKLSGNNQIDFGNDEQHRQRFGDLLKLSNCFLIAGYCDSRLI